IQERTEQGRDGGRACVLHISCPPSPMNRASLVPGWSRHYLRAGTRKPLWYIDVGTAMHNNEGREMAASRGAMVAIAFMIAACGSGDAPPVEAQAAPAAQPAAPQTAAQRREALSRMIPKHDGYLGALAPENLAKERPAPPFDLTGTWFVDLSRAFSDFRYGPPYPEFIGQAKTDYEYSQTLQRGQSWRDAIGQCFPAGQPMVMTRVWPIAMVQLPTVIYMVSNFNNEFRQIFL